MAVASDIEIANYARQAGLPEKHVPMAVAIAIAESSGRVEVYNGICCYGLWQINARVHKRYTPRQLQNPLNNAREMVRISNSGRNWRPWEVYTNGMYRRFLDRGRAVGSDSGAITDPGLGFEFGPFDVQDSLTPFLQRIGTSVLLFIVGSILVVIGVIMLGGGLGISATDVASFVPGQIGKAADVVKAVT